MADIKGIGFTKKIENKKRANKKRMPLHPGCPCNLFLFYNYNIILLILLGCLILSITLDALATRLSVQPVLIFLTKLFSSAIAIASLSS
jgi:hypothetical protein